jgi:hypothetical protein
VDSGRAISFVTLGTRDLPTLRFLHRAWGWTERHAGDDEFAQSDAGGVRLALGPFGRAVGTDRSGRDRFRARGVTYG